MKAIARFQVSLPSFPHLPDFPPSSPCLSDFPPSSPCFKEFPPSPPCFPGFPLDSIPVTILRPPTPPDPPIPPFPPIPPIPPVPPIPPIPPIPPESAYPYLQVTFPSTETHNDIAITGDQYTTERTINPFLPLHAVVKKVYLAAFVTAVNNSAFTQKIGIQVQGRLDGGTWVSYFSQANCIGLPPNDGSTTSYIAISNPLFGTAKYGFRLRINQSSANSVRYITQFALIYIYSQEIAPSP